MNRQSAHVELQHDELAVPGHGVDLPAAQTLPKLGKILLHNVLRKKAGVHDAAARQPRRQRPDDSFNFGKLGQFYATSIRMSSPSTFTGTFSTRISGLSKFSPVTGSNS